MFGRLAHHEWVRGIGYERDISPCGARCGYGRYVRPMLADIRADMAFLWAEPKDKENHDKEKEMKLKVGQTIWGLACVSPKDESKLDLSPTYIAEMTKRKLLCRNSRLGIFGWVWKKDFNTTWFFHKREGVAWLEANGYRKVCHYDCNSERWVKESKEGE